MRFPGDVVDVTGQNKTTIDHFKKLLYYIMNINYDKYYCKIYLFLSLKKLKIYSSIP